MPVDCTVRKNRALIATINTHLRLSGMEIRLDQDLSYADVFADIGKCLFHGFPGPQDGHSAYPVGGHALSYKKIY